MMKKWPPTPGTSSNWRMASSNLELGKRICACDFAAMSTDYWENRYQTGDMPWEKGEPSPGLVDFLAAHPGLRRGSVAVPGCGSGHDVRAWARAGFEAFGYDLAPSAVRLGRDKTKGTGLSAQFQLADFLAD